MLSKAKKSLSLVIAMVVVIVSIMPAASAAQIYPEGITKQQVSDAIPKLDTAINNLLEGTQEGKNLPVPHCIKSTEGWALDIYPPDSTMRVRLDGCPSGLRDRS